MRWNLFPKLFQQDSVERLADRVRAAGLDTTKAVVRDDYWVRPGTLAFDLTKFIDAMAHESVVVDSASTTYTSDDLVSADSPLPIFANCGITAFRMGWFPLPEANVRDAVDRSRAAMERVADACERYGVRAIYQLHHRTLVSSPSAAYALVRDLDPNYVGVEIDPGNQLFEGFESWMYACELLRDYVRWVSVKDARRVDGRLRWTPLGTGLTDWDELVARLHQIGFDGDFVLMPFYDDEPPERWDAMLASDFAFLREIVRRQFGEPRG